MEKPKCFSLFYFVVYDENRQKQKKNKQTIFKKLTTTTNTIHVGLGLCKIKVTNTLNIFGASEIIFKETFLT